MNNNHPIAHIQKIPIVEGYNEKKLFSHSTSLCIPLKNAYSNGSYSIASGDKMCKTVAFELKPDIILIPECPICFIEINKMNRVVLNCNHEFCAQCILYMTEQKMNITCPICRKPIHSIFLFSKELKIIYNKQKHSHLLNIVYSGGYINWIRIYSYIPYMHIICEWSFYFYKTCMIYILVILTVVFLFAFIHFFEFLIHKIILYFTPSSHISSV
jgi:hypothetical protein